MFEMAMKEAKELKISPPVSPEPESLLEYSIRASKRRDMSVPHVGLKQWGI